MHNAVNKLKSVVAEELLSHAPDTVRAIDSIQSTLELDIGAAEQALAQIVEKLNLKLFHSVKTMDLLLVEGCNLACGYCFERSVLNSSLPRKRVMNNDLIEKSIDFFIRYSGSESDLQLALFGGEPTLNYGGIRHAISYGEQCSSAMNKKIHFNMTSNGILLDKEIIDYLADHKVKILLSIDGVQKAHDRHRVTKNGEGTYVKVMENMRLLKKRQPWIGIKMTIMPDIVDTLYESVLTLHALGVNQFLIGHATGAFWSSQSINKFASEMRRLCTWYENHRGTSLRIAEFDEKVTQDGYFGCSAGRTRIAVAVNGDITGCARISTLDDKMSHGLLGNVRLGLFAVKQRLEMRSCSSLRQNCEELSIAKEYRGGCFATNYDATGSLFQPNILQHNFSLMLRDVRLFKKE